MIFNRRVTYFLGNVSMGGRVVFLLNYLLVLFLLKGRSVWAFLNQKKKKDPK